jgi:hypothetical protein
MSVASSLARDAAKIISTTTQSPSAVASARMGTDNVQKYHTPGT